MVRISPSSSHLPGFGQGFGLPRDPRVFAPMCMMIVPNAHLQGPMVLSGLLLWTFCRDQDRWLDWENLCWGPKSSPGHPLGLLHHMWSAPAACTSPACYLIRTCISTSPLADPCVHITVLETAPELVWPDLPGPSRWSPGWDHSRIPRAQESLTSLRKPLIACAGEHGYGTSRGGSRGHPSLLSHPCHKLPTGPGKITGQTLL